MPQSNYREPFIGRWRRARHVLIELWKRGFDPRFMWYRIKFRWAPKLDIVTKFPSHLDIELSDACNLRCIMCIQGIEDGVKGASIIDTSFAKRLLDQGAGHGLQSIKLNWRGEPALHKDMVEIIQYAKSKKIRDVQMNTNGLLYDAERIRAIILAGLDRVIFSMDGATKETYERIRVRANYEKLYENVMLFWKIRNDLGRVRPFIRIQMVRMKDNAHEVQQFLAMWKPYVDDIRIMDAYSASSESRTFSVGDQVPVGRARCPQPWQRMIVSRDGKVLPCCSDWHREWIIGDATKDDLTAIWTGKKMTALRSLLREKRLDEFAPCNHCFVKDSYVWGRVTEDNQEELQHRVKQYGY